MKYLILDRKTVTVDEVVAAARKAGAVHELRAALRADRESAQDVHVPAPTSVSARAEPEGLLSEELVGGGTNYEPQEGE